MYQFILETMIHIARDLMKDQVADAVEAKVKGKDIPLKNILAMSVVAVGGLAAVSAVAHSLAMVVGVAAVVMVIMSIVRQKSIEISDGNLAVTDVPQY